MKILELGLVTADLAAQRDFYAQKLGLPIIDQDSSHVVFSIGRSRLVLRRQENFTGRYHLAFDVPNNQLSESRAWLEERAPIIKAHDGSTLFHSSTWNADQFYFPDAAGNILEFIARQTIPTQSNAPFSSASLVAITEIGLATEDVPAVVEWFGNGLGIPVYLNQSPSFTPIGDETGLLIIVENQREWFPNTGVKAVPLPVELLIEGEIQQDFMVPNLPYHVRVTPGV